MEASTSHDDLIDAPCSSTCNENSWVNANLDIKKNKLKIEIEKFKKDLKEMKQSNVIPAQNIGGHEHEHESMIHGIDSWQGKGYTEKKLM